MTSNARSPIGFDTLQNTGSAVALQANVGAGVGTVGEPQSDFPADFGGQRRMRFAMEPPPPVHRLLSSHRLWLSQVGTRTATTQAASFSHSVQQASAVMMEGRPGTFLMSLPLQSHDGVCAQVAVAVATYVVRATTVNILYVQPTSNQK
jgi:hypothetical protein